MNRRFIQYIDEASNIGKIEAEEGWYISEIKIYVKSPFEDIKTIKMTYNNLEEPTIELTKNLYINNYNQILNLKRGYLKSFELEDDNVNKKTFKIDLIIKEVE